MGRALLTVGIKNVSENRTLREPSSTATKFVAKNALFSYMNLGMPNKKKLGTDDRIKAFDKDQL